jgi:hypothetical protein
MYMFCFWFGPEAVRLEALEPEMTRTNAEYVLALIRMHSFNHLFRTNIDISLCRNTSSASK